MLKTIFFFLKVAVVVAVAIWLAERPGTITIDWLGYNITAHVGVVLAAFLIGLFVLLQLYRLWRSVVAVPDRYRAYSKTRATEKGYAALTQGLVAVASGNQKKAMVQARKAKQLLPELSLVRLLSAQAALMNDNKEDAKENFTALLDDKSASFFGVRGLLNQALAENDYARAITLLREADKMYPKTRWIIEALFDLELQSRAWKAAEETLLKAYKAKLFGKERYKQHKAAFEMAKADQARAQGHIDTATDYAREAWRLDDAFPPAVELYANLLVEKGQPKKAISIVEKAWKKYDHPDTARLWLRLMPDNVKNDDYFVSKWVKKLLKFNKASFEGRLRYAIAAMDDGLMSEARGILLSLEEERKTERLYFALADLEVKQFKDENKAQTWLHKAVDVGADLGWACDECHVHSPAWSPVCGNCDGFNTQKWTHFDDKKSGNIGNSSAIKRIRLGASAGFIEPPQA